MVLAMYVTNNMIDEALLFLRKNQNAANEEEIFAHFYKGNYFSLFHVSYSVLNRNCYVAF